MENKVGRPTKYKDDYPSKLVDFFRMIISTGNFPTFEGFAAKISVNSDTLHEWKNKIPEFSESYSIALNLQKENLFMKTLRKDYDSSFAKFLASACYGMSDKTQVDQTSSDGSMTPQITINNDLSHLSDDDLIKIKEILSKNENTNA